MVPLPVFVVLGLHEAWPFLQVHRENICFRVHFLRLHFFEIQIVKVADEEEEAVAKQNPWLKGLADIDAARFSNANDMIRARKNGSAGDTLLTQFAAKQTMYDDLRTEVFNRC